MRNKCLFNINFINEVGWALKLLDRVVSGASLLTEGVFECDIAHRRSVAVLCMLYKIGYNWMRPLYRALPGPYVPSTGYTRCFGRTSVHLCPSSPKNSQYRRTLLACQYRCGTIGMGSKTGQMSSCWPSCFLTCLSPTVFPFFSFILWVGILGLRSSDW